MRPWDTGMMRLGDWRIGLWDGSATKSGMNRPRFGEPWSEVGANAVIIGLGIWGPVELSSI
jgi:hypothetical protein